MGLILISSSPRFKIDIFHNACCTSQLCNYPYESFFLTLLIVGVKLVKYLYFLSKFTFPSLYLFLFYFVFLPSPPSLSILLRLFPLPLSSSLSLPFSLYVSLSPSLSLSKTLSFSQIFSSYVIRCRSTYSIAPSSCHSQIYIIYILIFVQSSSFHSTAF